MRNFELDKNDPFKVLISESGLESPGQDFKMNILNKLATQVSSPTYEPVISIFAMKIIGAILSAFFIGVFFFVPGSESSHSIWNQLPEFSLPSVNLTIPALSFPKIELGAVFNISIAIFSLLAFSISLLASRKLRYQ